MISLPYLIGRGSPVAFAPEYRKFPVIFPVSREFAMENGSTATAHTATASSKARDP